jgi:dephospho-CoA kinase
MKMIGVSGPIGAGKSRIVQALTEDRALARDLGGAILSIDADSVLREARRSSLGLQRAIATIAPDVQRDDGSLDSARLASAAFERPELLRALEALQWPLAREAISGARAAGEASGAALLLVEAIALLDSGLAESLDGVLLIDAPREIRQARLLERGVAAEDFTRREAVQSGLRTRLLAAGALPIDAGQSVAEGAAAAADALRLLCSTGERNPNPTD